MRKYTFASLRALLVIAVAITLFVTVIHFTDYNGKGMKQLVVTDNSGITTMKPKPVNAVYVPPSESELAEVKALGKSNPGQTGQFEVLWNAKGGKDYTALLFVEYLPTVKDVSVVQSEAVKAFLSPSALKTQTVTKVTPIHSSLIPGLIADSTFSSTTKNESNIFIAHFGRALFSEVLTGTNLSTPQSVALAEREYALLKKEEPGFQIQVKSQPIWLDIVFFLFVALAAAVVFGGREWRDAQRKRREEHQAARERYHLQTRGSKVLKGQRSRSGGARARR